MNQLKKVLAAAMSAFLVFGAAGCSSSADNNTGNETKPAETRSSEAVLEEIWQKDDDANKPAIFGGLGEDTVEGEAQAFQISDTEMIQNSYVIPQDVAKEALNGAGIMNAMMANNFTASVLQMSDTVDMTKAAQDIIKGIKENHWMCGFPEEYAVAVSGQYVITAFGLSETLNPFMDAAKAVLPNLDVIEQAPLE